MKINVICNVHMKHLTFKSHTVQHENKKIKMDAYIIERKKFNTFLKIINKLNWTDHIPNHQIQNITIFDHICMP